MRQTYKNKRDFYKKELERVKGREYELAQTLERERRWRREVEEKEAQKKKEDIWYDVVAYCENCEQVKSYRIRRGLSLNEGGCLNCNVKGKMHNVKKYPGMIRYD